MTLKKSKFCEWRK